jgi:hypothetical protein
VRPLAAYESAAAESMYYAPEGGEQ